MPEWKKQGYPVASTVKYLQELISKDIPHVLVDVRPKQEAEKEHIKGAVNIPLDELAKAKKLFPKQKNAPIIIYCTKDNLSQKAFDIVRKWGYINTSYLEGGIDAWKKAGGEVLSGQLKKEIVYVPKPKPGTIGIEEFKKITGKIPPNVIILDVRDPEETQMGMIKGAKNIPVNELKDRLNELPKDKEIIVHCATGMRAEMAYNILKEAGYNVKFLDASIQIKKGGKYKITEN
ncbi:3-mercaptopyruvate sulfurtransferase SseA, contains two rhodanese domains [Thermodesulfovibrio aggregans]|uniref:3-mercaptopyruvate sulfurtransferase SseA, contains two rhodanese domains n=1 Tax=Thermodesulfovibrio aggregans TaxID=86166 RepID=A0A0U9HWY1_9BACT|nr:rhodanese-like domain-containing protein [Thermodesulfovibrio aggregans]GAQ95039.1 3-mercaptopyruvate sulfurtransferase SseA, contains two rhodanese domains [Thermodesulfovibrio aggregans]